MENKVSLFFWVIIILGAVTAYLDYDRMMNGKIPVFCKESYDSFTKTETFRGIFYIAERQVKRNPKERLGISSDVHYRFLHKNLTIETESVTKKNDFILLVTPSLRCPEVRQYYEFETNKVYIDCIASIKVKQKKEKESKDLNEVMTSQSDVLDDILLKASFTGIESDKTTERFVLNNESFANKTLYIFRCHNGSNRNVYITVDSKYRNYCG